MSGGRTLLIAINGKKGSGKNTAADVIHEWGNARGLTVCDHGFADLLKYSCMLALGFDVETINDGVVLADSLKWNGDISVAIPGQSVLRAISGREYLQRYGTEAHRDVFGKDFWVDQLLPFDKDWRERWVESGEFLDIAVITDLRFRNEAERVRELGGEIWNIDRPDLDSVDGHESEQPLPSHLIDLWVVNGGTLEQFKTEINSWMTAHHHMRYVEKPDPLAAD